MFHLLPEELPAKTLFGTKIGEAHPIFGKSVTLLSNAPGVIGGLSPKFPGFVPVIGVQLNQGSPCGKHIVKAVSVAN